MRICFLNHALDPATGSGRFATSLLRALRKVDPAFEPTVLTVSLSGARDEMPLLAGGMRRALFRIPQIRRVFKKCDLIHALDGYPFGVIAELTRLGLRKPLVITAIGTGALQPLRRPLIGSLLRFVYRRADALVAVSQHTRRELAKALPGREVAVINHGVDPEEFRGDALSNLTIRERSVIADLGEYVLSVGALKPRKGFSYSLSAFARIRGAFTGLRYVIVGNGKRQELDLEIERLGLAGAVTVLQNVSQPFLIALYQGARLFVLLPHSDRGDVEGFGLVFLEAAAAGVPVIGTRESGAEDAVRHGKNGFLVPPRDAEAASIAMARILKDPILRGELSSGSRAFAERMSWENVARQYLALYRRLLAKL